MSVNGLPFLLFVLLCVLVYYRAPKPRRWIVLLLASAAFYLSYGVQAGVYLGATVSLTYAFGLRLEELAARTPAGQTPEERRREKRRLAREKRAALAGGLLLNFSALAVLKYTGFAVGVVNGLLRREALQAPSLLLPLGISFYIFQSSAYLIDISRGKYPAQHSLARYALFVCWFPQMVQGPINRYEALGAQLYEGNDPDWENIQGGILRMMLGILKKAMIADALAPAVERVYTGYTDYPGVVSFLGSALYCVQLYCDFSGGVDLLCGVSRLFGVGMQENFRQPYFSTSLSEFWRRWHISLGEWMKDYLFYPLALSKAFGRLSKRARGLLPPAVAKRLAPCLATFVVFLAVGVWQGPGWANIAYGLWNGFWMSLGLLWVPVGAKLGERLSGKGWAAFFAVWGIVRTNFLVIIGRYFSHAASLHSALGMLRWTAASPGLDRLSRGTLWQLGLTIPGLRSVGLSLCVLFAISLARERGVDVERWICTRKWYVQFVILFFALWLIVTGVYGNMDYTPIAYVYANV